ncbi:MAG: DUF6702 family protein [Verrucomicrobiota bacterium]
MHPRPPAAPSPLSLRRAQRLYLPHIHARRFFAATVLLALFALPAPLLRAHPIHTSLAEADYNAKTKTLEVALRVFADDFEEALSARAKKKITLEHTPAAEFTALAQAYLAAGFTLRRADGIVAPHTWIGREFKDATNELWLFFEIALPAGLEGTRLRHALLSEQFADQLNSLLLRDGPRSLTLAFLPGQEEKTVRLRSPAPPSGKN